MKTMLMIATGIGVLLLASSAVRAEEKDTAKMLVGKWEASKVDEGTLPQGTIVEFTKDGKVKVTHKKGDESIDLAGTYTFANHKLTVKLKMNDEEKEHTVTIKKISATEFVAEHEDGKSITFTKKK
ncbi:MAG TPA: lipocalin family protein [Gemmataceae bacterium]|nr:lipocalin family protein [Gemmataceae bacterium]